jgi:uncharacterized protein YqjF (DUF2071 family)
VSAIAAGTSELARRRLLSLGREPLFYAGWNNALFIHYETDPEILQRCIPYPLDLFHGRAFVSLVAFRLRAMRPRFGGRLGTLLVRPIATHNFLNVRTYVRYRGEPAIFFMREWLNSRLSVLLGPSTFGLPYHFAKIDYRNDGLRGSIHARNGSLIYEAKLSESTFATCEPESLTEFLLERYTAFTQPGRRKRFFRIWHEPWEQVSTEVEITAGDLIGASGDWYRNARLIDANYSTGVDVWMGWPHRLDKILGTENCKR